MTKSVKSAEMHSAFDLAPPPPQPPPPPSATSHHHTSSYRPSLIVITAILSAVIIISAAIQFLLRRFSRHGSSPSDLSLRRVSAAPTTDVIGSLPLISLAALPKPYSRDCAVCLSPFRPADELRLLPACRHAFHAPCVDTWLRSTPSCPLCRASVTAAAPPPDLAALRVEIGSVSRRRDDSSSSSAAAAAEPSAHRRSYSLGSSFEYVVEDDVEARVVQRRPDKEAPPPGDEVAEGGRGWLREYVDRLATSASSSFNSLRYSGRRSEGSGGGGGSRRFDGGGGGGSRRWGSWDLELEESGFGNFYRWLMGTET